MRKLFAAIWVFSFVATAPMASFATALSVKALSPVVDPVASWAGFYVGGSVGVIWNHDSGLVSTGATPATPRVPGSPAAAPLPIPVGMGNASGVTGGVQAGYNWQRDHFVFGFEGDFKGTNINSTTTLVAPVPAGFNANPGNSFTLNEQWDASIRGRLGYAWKNFLVYGTGGVAFLQTHFTSNFQPTVSGVLPFPGSVGAQSSTLTGYTVGAGGEYLIRTNWSVGLEYRYSNYGPANYGLGTRPTFGFAPVVAPPPGLVRGRVGRRGPPVFGPAVFAFAPVSASDSIYNQQVLVKVSYHFGGAASAKD